MLKIEDFLIGNRKELPMYVLDYITKYCNQGIAITGYSGCGKTELMRCYSVMFATQKKYLNVSSIDEIESSYTTSFIIDALYNDASSTILFTHNAETTYELIEWICNVGLMIHREEGLKPSITSVIKYIHYDIHLAKIEYGESQRYIERITEIIPSNDNNVSYITNDIISFDKQTNSYRMGIL